MTENPAVEEREKPAVEETKPEEKKSEESPKPEEKSSLEQKREELLKAEEKPAEEKKPEEEFVEEELDMDALKEKHPIIDKLGLKHSSVTELLEDVLTRYDGGQEKFQENAEFIAKLEKKGIVTSTQKDELLAKLKAKEDITPPAKPEEEKTSRQSRSERLAKFIPQQVHDPDTIDPTTGEVSPGTVRPLTEEEKVTKQKEFDDFAETISRGDLPDTVDDLQERSLNQEDELAWTLFRLQPILEEHKDKLLSNDIRKQILDHAKKFPLTYKEIVNNAREKGENHYNAVYHHFITSTKQEQIDAEKKKQWKEEHQKEEEKKKATKVETVKREGESLEPQKTFAEKSLMAKRKAIEGTGG